MLANSYRDVELITAISQTTYSKWMDVSWANELYSYMTFAEAVTGTSESIQVTLERETPYVTPATTTVLTHSAATGAVNEEKHAYTPETDNSAPDVHNQLGYRVRWKYVSSSGAFSASQIITMTMTLYAFRR
jgi:hypothetical protein